MVRSQQHASDTDHDGRGVGTPIGVEWRSPRAMTAHAARSEHTTMHAAACGRASEASHDGWFVGSSAQKVKPLDVEECRWVTSKLVA
eukprot:scaffold47245_cov66-Phaeocystis_antarctica.AAC.1